MTRPGTFRSRYTDNDVTDHQLYLSRRKFIGHSGLAALAGMAGYIPQFANAQIAPLATRIRNAKTTRDHRDDLTPFGHITGYNNFYELGTDKSDPAVNADALQTEPWTISVEGECAKPGRYTLEDILAPHALEERIYKLRCVEAWSMIIPWTGFPHA